MLQLKDIKKTLGCYDTPFAVEVSLDLPQGEVTALTGPSGGGKSTLLRLIAGLERPDSGTITFGSELWVSHTQYLDTCRRPIGMVFQDYALFPHLTVRDNVAFGAAGDSARVNELITLFDLEPLVNRRPHKLSGGQKQRVALARALARQPELLLLDEVFSAQDAVLRQRLWEAVTLFHREENITVIMVSHYMSDVRAMASYHVKLCDGQVVFAGKISQHENST